MAARFLLENARAPENMRRGLGYLVNGLAGPEHASLRRAFVVWLKPEVTDSAGGSGTAPPDVTRAATA